MIGLHHHHQRMKDLTGSGAQAVATRGYVDKAMYVIGMVAPFMTVPQIFKIWHDQNAAGVSLLSWSGYALGSFCWLIYGIVHKAKPVIVANVAAFVFQLAVVIGVLWFS